MVILHQPGVKDYVLSEKKEITQRGLESRLLTAPEGFISALEPECIIRKRKNLGIVDLGAL